MHAYDIFMALHPAKLGTYGFFDLYENPGLGDEATLIAVDRRTHDVYDTTAWEVSDFNSTSLKYKGD